MKRKRKKKRRRGLRDTEIYRDIQRLHNHNSELYRCETNRLNVHHIVVGFWEWKLSPKSLAQEPTSDESVESEDWIGLVPIGYFKPVISFSHTFSTSVTSYVSLQFITIHYICSYRIGLISGSSLHSSELGSVEAIVCSLQPVTGERWAACRWELCFFHTELASTELQQEMPVFSLILNSAIEFYSSSLANS